MYRSKRYKLTEESNTEIDKLNSNYIKIKKTTKYRGSKWRNVHVKNENFTYIEKLQHEIQRLSVPSNSLSKIKLCRKLS